LFHGKAIVLAALLALALFYLTLILLAGLVARVENVRDVKDYDNNHERRIEEGILE